jgi:hypothetical protein
VLSCVGRGLYDGLITSPKESYQVCTLRNIQCEMVKVLSRTVEPHRTRRMVVCLRCFTVIRLHSVDDRVTHELERTWQEAVVT